MNSSHAKLEFMFEWLREREEKTDKRHKHRSKFRSVWKQMEFERRATTTDRQTEAAMRGKGKK